MGPFRILTGIHRKLIQNHNPLPTPLNTTCRNKVVDEIFFLIPEITRDKGNFFKKEEVKIRIFSIGWSNFILIGVNHCMDCVFEKYLRIFDRSSIYIYTTPNCNIKVNPGLTFIWKWYLMAAKMEYTCTSKTFELQCQDSIKLHP